MADTFVKKGKAAARNARIVGDLFNQSARYFIRSDPLPPRLTLSPNSVVCRDYAHLAITLCRCMNVPARYCTGYLGDMGTEPPYGPGDFAAWFEAYLGGRWYTFDPRNNVPRLGRILMARGRDATDVAIVTSFGPCTLAGFKVITDEVTPAPAR